MAESYATSVGDVADRHGLSKTQVFTWRREARKAGERAQPEPVFAPVVIEIASAPAAPARIDPKPKKSRRARGGIELEIDGVVMRVERGAEARTVAAVIQALKVPR